MLYASIKLLHMSTVTLSVLLFVLRWFGRHRQQAWSWGFWGRWFPHLIDSVLLGSALTLLHLAGFNPLDHLWLLSKLVLLVVYILIGAYALRAATASRRVAGLLAALSVFALIVAIALTKSVPAAI
jgi:uncharacterized membrane protein SirB2